MSDTTKPSYISRFVSLLPFISILIFAFGTLKLYCYYSSFNVNILSYIDISELLPVAFKDLIPFLIGAITLSGGAVIVQLINNKNRKAQNLNNQEKVQASLKKRAIRSEIIIWTILSILLIGVITIFIFRKFPDSDIYFFLFDSTFFLSLYIFYRLKKSTLKLDSESLITAFVTCFLVLNSIIMSIKDIRDVKTHHLTTDTYIVFKNLTIVSTSKYYFIGRTKSYVFFYNEQKDIVDIFSTADISQMNLSFKVNSYPLP